MRRCLAPALILGLLSSALPVRAATVTVQGTVVLPACDINSGAMIKVNFGTDVVVSRIDGKTYKKMPVPYRVTCDGDMSDNSGLQISISGAAASFGSGLLNTDKAGLGVQFLSNGSALPVNTGAAKFDYLTGEQPTIEAVLAQDVSSPPEGGAFTATATMSVDYQ